MSDTPVVVINGARQTGKSTLVKQFAESDYPAKYFTLDDMGVLAAAHQDPAGFIDGLPGPVIIDEIQREPALFLPIKAKVDRDRKPGSFLLTGSADVMLLPKISKILAGRMELLTLWPLSQCEIAANKQCFIDTLFSDRILDLKTSDIDRSVLTKSILSGGFPEALSRPSEVRRKAWFHSYITTILQREIKDLSNIEELTVIPRLLSLLASRIASLLNVSELSRSISIAQTTLKRYIALLEATFLLRPLPAWSGNLGKRLVKSPKVMLCDTGLAAYLLGADKQRVEKMPELIGPLLENFAVMELQKQTTWSMTQPKIFHFRSQTGQEVDVILENPAGQIVAIEIKSATTAKAEDFQGLKFLESTIGERLINGIVFYCGSQIIPFGRNLYALPISMMWK